MIPYVVSAAVGFHFCNHMSVLYRYHQYLRFLGVSYKLEAALSILSNIRPSFNPVDLMFGCIGAFIAAMIMQAYMEQRQDKANHAGKEFGSARWGNRKDIKPFVNPSFYDNVILTNTESLTMESRPKDPKTARNKNVLVIGGSGSGKSRFHVKPNLMQMSTK